MRYDLCDFRLDSLECALLMNWNNKCGEQARALDYIISVQIMGDHVVVQCALVRCIVLSPQ